MRRTNKLNVTGLPDPLLQYNWDLFIPNVPGFSGFDARSFRSRIMTTVIPGRTIEPVVIDLHGVTVERAGRMQYTRRMPIEIYETRDLMGRDTLRAWHEMTRDDSSQGAYSDEYTTTADLQLYDDKDKIIRTIRLYKCWLESFDDSALDGSASAAVTISGSLVFDYFEDL